MIAGFLPLGVLAALVFFRFSNTVTLGSVLVGAIVGLAGLAVLGYGARWKAAYETERITSASLQSGREAFKEKAERVETELHQALNETVALQSQVKLLETRTDLSAAMDQMHDEHEEILSRVDHVAELLQAANKEFPLEQE